MKTQGNNGTQKTKQSVRGRSFRGVVIADAMQKTVTVEWARRKHDPKYERYEKKRTRVKAHNPDNISAKKGDLVEIQECRPLSKTKHFVIVKKLGEERLFIEREKALEESKFKQHKEESEKQESADVKPAKKTEETAEIKKENTEEINQEKDKEESKE